MQDSFDEHVAIFWDYENCTPPSTGPGYDVVNNIRAAALKYGSVKLFKAYLELSEQSSAKTLGLRSELQSCGVSLTDCPHNGRKDVADKMMIVDMLTYAIDNPAPATIVLISGDRDFVYAVSVLRLRRYRVVVVAPNSAHTSLKSQASKVLDWEADIMCRTTLRPPVLEPQAPVDDILHRSPRRPALTLGGTLPPVIPKSYRRPSFRTAASVPVADLARGDGAPYDVSSQAHHMRTSSGGTVDGAFPANVTTLTDRSFYRGVGRQTVGPSAVWDEEDREEDVLGKRQPISDILDVMEDLQDRGGRRSVTANKLEVPILNAPVPPKLPSAAGSVPAGNTLQQKDVHSLPPSDQPVAADIVQPSDNTQQRHELVPPTNPPVLKVPHPIRFPTPEYQPPVVRPATVEPLSRLPSNPSPPVLITSPSRPPPPPRSPPVQVSTEVAVEPRLPVVDRSIPQSAPSPSSITQVSLPKAIPVVSTTAGSDSPSPNAAACLTPSTATTATLPTSTSPAHKASTLRVAQKYEVLVRVLHECKARGWQWPLRSHVGMRLRQLDPKVFAKAGVTTFKQYTTAAESEGIVILGGSTSDPWIAFSPDFDEGKPPKPGIS